MNPYEYDLDPFRDVPEELALYEETGRIDTGMKRPRQVDVDSKGLIYVAGDGGVRVFDGDGALVRGFKTGSAAHCIAVAADGTLYVGLENHVEVYSSDGKRQAQWMSLGENAFLTDVAVGKGEVFVADFDSKLVWRFDTTGKLLGHIGERDVEKGFPGFHLPSPYFSLALAPDGSLWVVNPGKLRVEKHTKEGVFQESWGEPDMRIKGFCGCCNPTDVEILADGSFVTSEKGLPRVKVYDAKGTLKAVVAGPKQFAEGTVGLDLAVDAAGRILVLDPRAKAVRFFSKKNERNPAAKTAPATETPTETPDA